MPAQIPFEPLTASPPLQWQPAQSGVFSDGFLARSRGMAFEDCIASPPLQWGIIQSGVYPSGNIFQSRTKLLKFSLAPTNGTVLIPVALPWQTADPIFGNAFLSSGRDYLIARNNHATITRYVKLRSYPEPTLARTGDILQLIPPGLLVAFPAITANGWKQLDGNVYVDSETADIQLLVLTI